MQGMEKITAAILTEAKEDAEKMRETGRAEAEKVCRFYEKEAERERAGRLKTAEKKAEEIHRRCLSQAEIESRNIKLAAKRQAVEQAFSLAQQKLAELPPEEKKTLYEKLIKGSGAEGKVTVQLNEADLGKLGWKLHPAGIIAVPEKTAGSFIGGLIIKEGLSETDCTFEALAEEARKRREPEIASMLFS